MSIDQLNITAESGTEQEAQVLARRPPRIAYLLRMYPRFSQTFIVNEIGEHLRQGLDVRILSLRKPNEGRFHESVCRITTRAHYAPTAEVGRLRSLLAIQWPLWRRSPRLYGNVVRILKADAQAEWHDLQRARYLLRWCREQGVDHVHVHFGTIEATVALLAHLLGGLSYSLTLHAFDIFRKDVDRPLLARKINASRFTITVSEFNRRYLEETLDTVDESKIRVNYNGIDLERFTPAKAPRQPYTVFGLGRLKEKKGFIHLVRAVKHLHDQGMEVTCRIAGEGEEERHLRNEIKRLKLGGQVTLLGEVGETRVRELMQQSSCFVLPCLQAGDGNVDALPTVLLEAMASGCPVISTHLSGIPEIIDDGANGMLVEPGDDRALAEAVRRILTDAPWAESLSRTGRRRAEERFDIRRNVAVMKNWFLALVNHSSACPEAQVEEVAVPAVERREACEVGRTDGRENGAIPGRRW